MNRSAQILSAIARRIAECEPGETLGSVKIYLDDLRELQRTGEERSLCIQDAARRAVESVAYLDELQSALNSRSSMGDRRDWDGTNDAERSWSARARQPWPRVP